MIDPDPGETFYEVHFACLLREGDDVRVVHDCHRHALFTRQQWREVIESAGFELTTPLLDEAVHESQVAFLARRHGVALTDTRAGAPVSTRSNGATE